MHRTIETGLWTEPTYQELTPDAKLMYMYYRTNSHTHLAGIYYLPIPMVEFETKLSINRIKKAMQELYSVDYIKFDTRKSIVWVVDMLKWSHTQGTKVIQAVEKQLKKVNSNLANDFVEYYKDLSISHPWVMNDPSDSDSDTDSEREEKIKSKPVVAYPPEYLDFFNRFDDYVLESIGHRMLNKDREMKALRNILNNRQVGSRDITLGDLYLILDRIIATKDDDGFKWYGKNMQSINSLSEKTSNGNSWKVDVIYQSIVKSKPVRDVKYKTASPEKVKEEEARLARYLENYKS